MPHAKIDTAFLRDHFADVPDKLRPSAIALYLELVLTSAEMLLDGVVPEHITVVCADRIGIARSRYGRSQVQRLVDELVRIGLVRLPKTSTSRSSETSKNSTSRSAVEPREVSKNLHSLASSEHSEVLQKGHLALVYWTDHHNSRAYVDDRRKADAERKRGKRNQPTLPGMGTNVRSGHRPGSAADTAADLARGRARTRSASASERTSSSDLPVDETTPDDELRLRLEHLGVNGRALTTALAEPDRATAWANYTDQHANGNAAGYFATSFGTGAWPPQDQTTNDLDTDDYTQRAAALYQRTHDLEAVADWLAGITRLAIPERERILAAVTAHDDDEPDLGITT